MADKEDIEYLDELEIEEELLKIQNLHETFDETNPITYAIMLNSNRKRLNPGQIKYLEMMINKYNIRQKKIYDKWSDYMTRDKPKEITNVEAK